MEGVKMIDVSFDGRRAVSQVGYKLISPNEKPILYALINFNTASYDILANFMWPDLDDMPEIWHIRIRSCVSRLNKKLRFLGSNYQIKRNKIGYKLERV